jgi:hypothetical protein
MIFPMLLIGLDLGASVVYAVALDWRRALYWACGSGADRVRYVLSGLCGPSHILPNRKLFPDPGKA